MHVARSVLVDTLREYLEVHERLTVLFARFRAGDLDFDSVRELCDDGPDSPLFRLKERCHALFRDIDPTDAPVRREALFDLAVGSLFHEAMKFRENFYQQVVYAPKVRALREAGADGADEDRELFREFEKIQHAAEERMGEALHETEALLALAGEQLVVLLRGRRDGLVARYLIEQAPRVDAIFAGGVDALLTSMFGAARDGWVAAAVSYIESAHFRHALRAIEAARAKSGASEVLDRLAHYADGMRAFLVGDYACTVDRLGEWVDAAPEPSEAGYALLAHSALSRIGNLVKDGDDTVVARAVALAERVAPLLPQTAAGGMPRVA
ncbi:MAG: hypothetical protein KC560_19465 [Myxococcales bacterium]|nr:hypothetical protein [Myxococcales bacterium]